MKIAIRAAVLAAFALAVMAGCASHPRLCDPGAPYPGESRTDNWGKC